VTLASADKPIAKEKKGKVGPPRMHCVRSRHERTARLAALPDVHESALGIGATGRKSSGSGAESRGGKPIRGHVDV
jgi:hypothetical protein